MNQTINFGIEFLEEAQSQKHLTINNALARMDLLAQLQMRQMSALPADADEGACIFLTDGAHSGQIAMFLNGGFEFVTPKLGWRGFDLDAQHDIVYDGTQWNSVSTEPAMQIVEFEHDIGTDGAITADVIPAHSIVYAVTGVVMATLSGDQSLSDWQLGVDGAPTRYGNGLWLGQGGWFKGITSAPQAYYTNTPLHIGAADGAVTQGEIRAKIYLQSFELPAV